MDKDYVAIEKKVFCRCYLQTSKLQLSQFLNSFEPTLAKLTESKSHNYRSGDINIDLLKCDKESIKNYQAILLSLGCK